MLVEHEGSPNAIHTLFCTPKGSLFAFDSGEHVVHVHHNKTSIVSKGNVEGIPETHGVATTDDHAWVSVVNMAKRSMTRVSVTTGVVSVYPGSISIQHLFHL